MAETGGSSKVDESIYNIRPKQLWSTCLEIFKERRRKIDEMSGEEMTVIKDDRGLTVKDKAINDLCYVSDRYGYEVIQKQPTIEWNERKSKDIEFAPFIVPHDAKSGQVIKVRYHKSGLERKVRLPEDAPRFRGQERFIPLPWEDTEAYQILGKILMDEFAKLSKMGIPKENVAERLARGTEDMPELYERFRSEAYSPRGTVPRPASAVVVPAAGGGGAAAEGGGAAAEGGGAAGADVPATPPVKKSRTGSERKYKTKKRKRIKGGKKTKVVIKKSTNPKKKYMAIFSENGKKVKTTHFGAAGMSDYTKHKNKTRKNRYMTRHRRREHWNDYMSAGSLSRYILWNKPTLKASITDYKRRFGLE